jgi:hypothetical protein
VSFIAGGAETPHERIARLVAEGQMTREAVIRAERFWSERLAGGVPLPTGEIARIELADLYHLIVDSRIWRKPERIERLLRGVFEIRQAERDRRRALSTWDEDGVVLLGYAILGPDGKVWTMHLIGNREVRRSRRKERLIWRP